MEEGVMICITYLALLEWSNQGGWVKRDMWRVGQQKALEYPVKAKKPPYVLSSETNN